MGKSKKIFSVFLIMICTNVCFARQIAFQIVQHDESTTEVLEQSLVVEDAILNGFFDAGFIVTNSSAEVSTSEDQDEILLKKGIGEAFEGYSEYFVQIKLYFMDNNEQTKGKKCIEQADWIITSAKTGNVINNNSIEVSKNTKSDDVYKISSDLLIQIKKAIKA